MSYDEKKKMSLNKQTIKIWEQVKDGWRYVYYTNDKQEDHMIQHGLKYETQEEYFANARIILLQ
jgi:hypothetical protein